MPLKLFTDLKFLLKLYYSCNQLLKMYSEPKGLYFWWIQVAYIKLRGIYFLALLNTKYRKFQVSIGF